MTETGATRRRDRETARPRDSRETSSTTRRRNGDHRDRRPERETRERPARTTRRRDETIERDGRRGTRRSTARRDGEMDLGNATIRQDRDDQRSWKLDKFGQFSVNSAALGLAKLVPRLSVKGIIWKNLVPTKLCFFAWLVWHNRINTVDNLQRKWITLTFQPSRCELCGQGGETMNHLFLVNKLQSRTSEQKQVLLITKN
ncbi:hypothetical protein Syun_017120 [Stephania yunnanensis]|uniref:Reverse transcriptase zinc-binding domain-containing protein n=1 Tax=Stephania yunnanensis TaxID=152371 RepID=A0AAP0J6F7_9MAGN